MPTTNTPLSDGGYAAMSVDGSTGNYTIHLQKYDSSGAPVGSEVVTTSNEPPQLVALAGGGYALGTDFAQRYGSVLTGSVFDASGVRIAGFSGQTQWHLAASPLGGFVVTSIPGQPNIPPQPVHTEITLYDVSGQVVRQGPIIAAGPPTATVDDDGVYHVRWADGSLSHDLSIDPRSPPDLTPPAAPAAFQLVDDHGPQTGLVAAGGATDDNTLVIRVPVTELGAVGVAANVANARDHFVAVTQADIDRGYVEVPVLSSLSDGHFPDGAVTLRVQVEDANGIVSGATSETFTVDTSVSGAPTIAHVTDDQGLQQGEIANGGTTDDVTPTFQFVFAAGTQAGDKLVVSDNGATATTYTLSAGDVSRGYLWMTLSRGDGAHSITAQITDDVGNVGASSEAFNFTTQAQTDHGAGQPVIGSGSGIAGNHQFYEKNLPTGTAPDSSQLSYSSSFTINSPDGVAWLEIDGHRVVENDQATFSGDPLTFKTGLGETLCITGYDATTGTVSYTYTLDTAVHHAQAGQPPVTAEDKPFITVVDHDGDTSHAAQMFPITDDEPKVTSDTASVQAGATLTGNVLANDNLGADGGLLWNPASRTETDYQVDANGEYEVRGDYGVLHIQQDGDYRYIAGAGAPAGSIDHFTLAITDGDGSSVRFGEHLDISIGTSSTLSIQSDGVSHAEGDSGLTDFVFTVTRTGDTSQQANVSWAAYGTTAGGQSAAQASDFAGGVMPNGTVTFAGGQTTQTIVVQVAGDTTEEANEAFVVELGGPPPGAQIGNNLAFGTIQNDDGASHAGATITSQRPGTPLNGTAGDDTIHASQGPDVITTGAGADLVVFHDLPWNAGHITDFAVGTDHLDLSAIFQASGYTGTDPVADGRMSFQDDGAGGTKVYFDHDQANGGDWPFQIVTLDHVSASGLTWAQLSAGAPPTSPPPPPPPPPPSSGQVITSSAPGSTVSGTSGSDTIYASQGPDTITTGAGDDVVAFRDLPWSAGHVTDFQLGSDHLDLSAIFQASGYAGSDPVADGRMRFEDDGAGGTKVYFDRDQADGGDWPFLITTLDHVSASGLTWAQLSASSSAGGGSGGAAPGEVITSDQYGDTLLGGSGDDTLNAGQGPDTLTGNGGADHFVFNDLPWRAGAITDFTPGVDKLDLRPLFQAAGYSGTDPIGDHHLEFRDDGHGNTAVYFDHDDPNGGDWPFLITTLQGVTPAQVGSGDWMFR